MKYFITLISIIILSSSMYAQQLPEFAPVGAVWHEAYPNIGWWPRFVESKETKVLEEVTIKGQVCKKLNWLPAGGADSSFIYQDGLKVYTYDPVLTHDWVLWLDFETELDSSWTWYRTDYDYRDWQTNQQTGRQDTILVTVLKKGDTTINGFTLPYMDVISSNTDRSPYENCSYGYVDTVSQFTKTTRIIWALGPVSGRLYLYCRDIDVAGQYDSRGSLRCYEDSTIGLVTNFEHPKVTDCDTEYYPDGGVAVDPEQAVDIAIKPNPVTDVFHLEYTAFDVSTSLEVLLVDLSGKSIKRWTFRSWTGSASFNIAEIDKGMYMLKVSHNEQLLKSEKITKY